MADTLETYRTVTPYLVVPDGDAEIKFLQDCVRRYGIGLRAPSGRQP